LAKNLTVNLTKFLRRAPVLAALLLMIALPVLRRRMTPWFGIGMAWVICYALSISIAYYTPRAALLPVVFSLAILAALVQNLVDQERLKFVQATVVILLLAGYGLSVSYAKLVIDDRLRHHHGSAVVASTLAEHGVTDVTGVYAEDMALLPATANRWCRPYGTLSESWLHDVVIKQDQRNGIDYLPLATAIQPGSGARVLIVNGGGEGDRLLLNLPGWQFLEETAGNRIYQRIE